MSGGDARVAELLDAVRAAVARDDAAEAERLCRQVLEIEPYCLKALKFVGERALADGEFAQAKQLLERAVEEDGGDIQLLKNLGLACMGAERLDEARFAFDRALTLEPDFFTGRLYLGGVLEALGHRDAALREYYLSILAAQRRGRWLGPDTTPEALRELVTGAMRFIDAGRKQRFVEALEPLRTSHGDEALARFDQALAVFQGEAQAAPGDAGQQPTFLYFPGLPATRWLEREWFDWYATLEDGAAAIREELLAVLHAPPAPPLFGLPGGGPEAAAPAAGDASSRQRPAWDRFAFYRRGVRDEENGARCPRTAALLESLPLVRIHGLAPEIAFAALAPGVRFGPLRGATNMRVVTHLPLIAPAGGVLVVGGEERAMQEGRCITFDDTFEHETRNDAAETCVVLTLETWHPLLSPVEREAIARLIEAVGAFERECGVVT